MSVWTPPPAIRALTVAVVSALALTGCTATGSTSDPDRGATTSTSERSGEDQLSATPAILQDPLVLKGESSSALALQSAQAFFTNSPVVVITAAGDELRAASAAAALGVPVLVDGPEVASEITRLGSDVALVLGDVNDPGIDVVVPKDDEELTKEDVLTFLDGKVAKWWLPDDVLFIEEVPKTSVGKFSKKDLRDQFSDYEIPGTEA